MIQGEVPNNVYTRNFLIEVLAKVDFGMEIEDIKDDLPIDLEKAVINICPVVTFNNKVDETYEFVAGSDNEIIKRANKNVYKEWTFFDGDKSRKVKINKDFMSISYSIYESFDILKDEFTTLLDALIESFPEITIKRFGLRYIDNIEPNKYTDTEEPLYKWEKYINSGLLSVFNFIEGGPDVSRVFHKVLFHYPDMKLWFQFGMHNPLYPAPIKTKQFILDCDAFSVGSFNRTDIASKIDEYHNEIKRVFESSITEGLRELMKE